MLSFGARISNSTVLDLCPCYTLRSHPLTWQKLAFRGPYAMSGVICPGFGKGLKAKEAWLRVMRRVLESPIRPLHAEKNDVFVVLGVVLAWDTTLYWRALVML